MTIQTAITQHDKQCFNASMTTQTAIKTQQYRDKIQTKQILRQTKYKHTLRQTNYTHQDRQNIDKQNPHQDRQRREMDKLTWPSCVPWSHRRCRRGRCGSQTGSPSRAGP